MKHIFGLYILTNKEMGDIVKEVNKAKNNVKRAEALMKKYDALHEIEVKRKANEKANAEISEALNNIVRYNGLDIS